MPPALQVQNFFAQNLTGGAFEPLAAGTGDSLTVQNANGDPCGVLADLRAVDDAGPCKVSVIGSRFHDQIEGIVGWVPDGSTLAPPNRSTAVSPPGADQPIYPSDVLTYQVLGTAADNVNASAIYYYHDLPGINAVLRSWQAVDAATVNLVGVDVAIDCSSTAQGDWSTAVAISAAGRRLAAGRFYAILGFTADVPCAVVGITSFETGNLRIGGPAIGDGEHDSSLIADLAKHYNAPLIPVIAGANQDTVLVQGADPAASNVNLTIMLAQLTGPI